MGERAGGELFRLLELQGCLSESAARFYAANVILALAALHSRGIAYRVRKWLMTIEELLPCSPKTCTHDFMQ